MALPRSVKVKRIPLVSLAVRVSKLAWRKKSPREGDDAAEKEACKPKQDSSTPTILASGAIALSVTLCGGVQFAS